MAIKVRSLEETAKRWTEKAAAGAAYYASGVAGAGEDWLRGAVNAGAAYKSGVSAGNIQQLFEGGIKRAGSAKYVRKATGPGAERFPGGVTAGEQDFRTGVDPFLAAIAGITLTPRGARGAEVNWSRVKQVGDPLHKKRLALRAAGG